MKYLGNRGSEDCSLEPNFNALSAEFYKTSDIKRLVIIDLTDEYILLNTILEETPILLFQILIEFIITLDILNAEDYEVLSIELEYYFVENYLITDDADGAPYKLFISQLTFGSKLNNIIQIIIASIRTILSKQGIGQTRYMFPYNWNASLLEKNMSVLHTLALT